jgi:ABC-2 type transport system ATP-binding protein
MRVMASGLPGLAAAIPILVLVVVPFAIVCLVDLARVRQVRYLPKWGWAVIICVSIPWGGLAYLVFGRSGQTRGLTGPSLLTRRPAGAAGLPVPSAGGQAGTAGRRVSPVMIEADGLTKWFGPVRAVDNLSFTVWPGQVTGFLGPNGAGKTTTMRVILGLDAPTSGSALVGGRAYQSIIRPLHEVGSLLDANAVHGGRTARVHLSSLAQSNGIGRRRVTEVLELTGLDAVADRRAGTFSLGMKQRLGIAAALLGDPPVLIFDEPVNGLDPQGIQWIRDLFGSLAAEGRTVLVSSHLMSEMSMSADHLIIIGQGRLLTDMGTKQFVDSNARKDVLVRSPRAAELAALLAAQGAVIVPEDDGGLSVTGVSAPQIADLAVAQRIPVHELTPRHASLEQAYLDLTGASVEYRARTPALTPTREGDLR